MKSMTYSRRFVKPALLPYARRPCPFPPGSEEKIAVLTLRAALRLPLFVRGDAGVRRRPRSVVRLADEEMPRWEATPAP